MTGFFQDAACSIPPVSLPEVKYLLLTLMKPRVGLLTTGACSAALPPLSDTAEASSAPSPALVRVTVAPARLVNGSRFQ